MKILAFDASTEALSVAFYDTSATERAAEIFEVAPRAHAARLLPAAHTLLAQAGLELSNLDGLAFARGPGAFTGLRIAAGLVQGLALGTGLPVAAVSTLAALACRTFANCPNAERAQVVQDARMGEVYTAVFSRQDLSRPEDAERVLPPAKLAIETGPAVAHAGNGWPLVTSADAIEIASELVYPHALEVARLGAAEFEAGRATQAAGAVPVYVRDDVARKASPVGKQKTAGT